MISFEEARAVVEAQHGPTLPSGYEDQAGYSVALAEPLLDDTVYLVDKATGALDIVPYWDVEARLQDMTPTDPSKEEEPS